MPPKTVSFRFYRAADLVGPDGKIAPARAALVEPVETMAANPAAMLRPHCKALAFEVACSRPELEGRTLAAELTFHVAESGEQIPILTARWQGEIVATRLVLLQTLDLGPLLVRLQKQRPELKPDELYFALSPGAEREDHEPNFSA